jgi:hypothetical protein
MIAAIHLAFTGTLLAHIAMAQTVNFDNFQVVRNRYGPLDPNSTQESNSCPVTSGVAPAKPCSICV